MAAPRERSSAEQLYRLISDGVTDYSIVLLDPDGFVISWTRVAELIEGYRPEEIMGEHFTVFWLPEEKAAAESALLQATQTGRVELEGWRLRKSGERYWANVVISATRSPNGELTGFIRVLRDQTARRVAEDALRESQDALRKSEEQLRQAQKMEAVGQLAGGIAHDFNNLLTAIRGHAELLLGEMASQHPLRSDLEEINRAAERASTLTRQLLAFSRRQILQPRVLDLDVVVAEMERLLRRLIGEDIELVTSSAAANAFVRADRGQLEQVLMNLAVNARDAMPAGGRLTITADTVTLDESYVRLHPGARSGAYVRLSVCDTGTGMDAGTLLHVFEPFFTTKAVGKGTGLGLAMVYGIVKQSGGYIAVESETGMGTTFEIYLPRVCEEPDVIREPTAQPEPSDGAHTILLVEDEDAVRSLASRILRDRGYAVLEARDGAEALRIAETYKGSIHILLTDVVMPRMGGRELVERLTPSRPGMRVVYMSGYTNDALVHYGVLSGTGTWFLEKPFTPKTLTAKLQAVLS
ncbi:MAG: ATP-binding protein [Longimicrobiales bacterium]